MEKKICPIMSNPLNGTPTYCLEKNCMAWRKVQKDRGPVIESYDGCKLIERGM